MLFLQRRLHRSPNGRKAGDRTYKKALSQRLICGVSNFANSISIRMIRQWSMSMVCIFTVERCVQRLYKTDFQTIRFQYTHGVGFGIAYPRMEGIAKA